MDFSIPCVQVCFSKQCLVTTQVPLTSSVPASLTLAWLRCRLDVALIRSQCIDSEPPWERQCVLGGRNMQVESTPLRTHSTQPSNSACSPSLNWGETHEIFFPSILVETDHTFFIPVKNRAIEALVSIFPSSS